MILCLAKQMDRILDIAKVEIWKHLRNEIMRKESLLIVDNRNNGLALISVRNLIQIYWTDYPVLKKTGPGSSAGSDTLWYRWICSCWQFITWLLASRKDELGSCHASSPGCWGRAAAARGKLAPSKGRKPRRHSPGPAVVWRPTWHPPPGVGQGEARTPGSAAHRADSRTGKTTLL